MAARRTTLHRRKARFALRDKQKDGKEEDDNEKFSKKRPTIYDDLR